MSDDKVIEHHWHEPTGGQVFKAMRQYLSETLDESKIKELVDKKIEEVVRERIAARMQGDAFEKMLISAVVRAVASEKKIIVEDHYWGTERRLAMMVEKELARVLTSEYTVKVEKKGSDPS